MKRYCLGVHILKAIGSYKYFSAGEILRSFGLKPVGIWHTNLRFIEVWDAEEAERMLNINIKIILTPSQVIQVKLSDHTPSKGNELQK